MPNLSRDYLSTLPSITKLLFYTSLSLTLLVSFIHSPLLSWVLSEHTVKGVQHYAGVFAWTFPFNLSGLWPYGLHRLVSPFFLHPALLSPTFVLSCASFITLVSYSRHIEEEHLLHPAGAAKYTTALLFAALCIVTLTVGQLYASAGAPLPKPPPPYFQTALSLVFFVVTLDTTYAPYEALSVSSLLQQWHSPYLLLVLFAALCPPAFASAMGGILLAYAHHVVTVGVGRVWGLRLWGTPDWLVALYERLGIGVRKIGLQAQEGGQHLGGE